MSAAGKLAVVSVALQDAKAALTDELPERLKVEPTLKPCSPSIIGILSRLDRAIDDVRAVRAYLDQTKAPE